MVELLTSCGGVMVELLTSCGGVMVELLTSCGGVMVELLTSSALVEWWLSCNSNPGVFNQGSPGGPRRHCRGSATGAYVDQFTIDFFYFYKYTWARRHIYV